MKSKPCQIKAVLILLCLCRRQLAFISARMWAVLCICLAVVMPSVSQATATSVSDTESDTMAVRELMRLDTELALRATQSRLDKAANDTSAVVAITGAKRGALKLVAIYGVGKNLMAEVLVGSQPYVYMRGQALPVGAKPGHSAYQLAGISGSCVYLKQQDDEHTLCLHPSLRVAR